MFKKFKASPKQNTDPSVLILEDDPDQMNILVSFMHSEIKKLLIDANLNEEQKQNLQTVQIISANNIKSLQELVSTHSNVLLAILDCNIPDEEGGVAHDQFIKTNHIITGQHKPVEILIKNLPDTPITMISSMNRFQRTVNKYYKTKHNLNINFIPKNEGAVLEKNIRYYLRKYLNLKQFY